MGGEINSERFIQFEYDLKKTCLDRVVYFLGTHPDPWPYFLAADIFALVSREDPFPLAMLEAASIGKPTVCFDGSGGAKEFVSDDCGYVVPYLDIEAMSEKIALMLGSDELRYRLGDSAAKKVRDCHDLEKCAPRILKTIQETAAFASSGRDKQLWKNWFEALF